RQPVYIERRAEQGAVAEEHQMTARRVQRERARFDDGVPLAVRQGEGLDVRRTAAAAGDGSEQEDPALPNDARPRVKELALSGVERGELFRRAAGRRDLPERAGANERDAVVSSPGGAGREFCVMLDRG